jgi:hypothetical protein
MRRAIPVLAVAAGVALLLGLTARVVLTAPDSALPWSVFGAGGNAASSTNYGLGSTAGQSAIGQSSSTNYQLGAGYWYGVGCAADFDGDAQCDPADQDEDNDGCTDTREQQPKGNANTGGGRNYHHFWDFYDTPNASNVRDKVVNVLDDILGVAGRFGASGAPGDPLAGPVPPPPAYHTAFDRGPLTTTNPLSLSAANGTINVFDDILGVAAQFGHNCA